MSMTDAEALLQPLFVRGLHGAAAAYEDCLKRLAAHLPDHHRLPIVHVKLEGLTVAETARLTGMSESAVKVGIHRGLKAPAARFAGVRA